MPTPKTTRADYKYIAPVQTRWADNDAYQHINNVIFYSFFDSIVNRFLIEKNVLNIQGGETIGLVVETMCRYFASAAFPEDLEGGLRVTKVGSSSVRYEIGIFGENENTPRAEGHFVHVYVDTSSRKPTPLPPALRSAVESILG